MSSSEALAGQDRFDPEWSCDAGLGTVDTGLIIVRDFGGRLVVAERLRRDGSNAGVMEIALNPLIGMGQTRIVKARCNDTSLGQSGIHW